MYIRNESGNYYSEQKREWYPCTSDREITEYSSTLDLPQEILGDDGKVYWINDYNAIDDICYCKKNDEWRYAVVKQGK